MQGLAVGQDPANDTGYNAARFDQVVGVLICAGHKDAPEYGYSYFRECLKASYTYQISQISAMSAAVQLAFADKKERQEFFDKATEATDDGSTNN